MALSLENYTKSVYGIKYQLNVFYGFQVKH